MDSIFVSRLKKVIYEHGHGIQYYQISYYIYHRFFSLPELK